jgi:hypothetical protein
MPTAPKDAEPITLQVKHSSSCNLDWGNSVEGRSTMTMVVYLASDARQYGDQFVACYKRQVDIDIMASWQVQSSKKYSPA